MQIDRLEKNDEELLSSIMAQSPGWRDPLAILLRRYRRSLLTRCFLYLRNRQDAEDAAQETELRVFCAIRKFRGDSSFRTWLFAIADRQCHDQARKRSRYLLSDHVRDLIEIHEDSLRYLVENKADSQLVSGVLERFPRRDRDILMLRFYLDFSLQDISEYLGIGLSATKMRLYRALELFGTRLEMERRA